jgi:hypothetical protein
MEIQIQKIDNVIFSFSRNDEGDDITPLVTSSEKLRKIINKVAIRMILQRRKGISGMVFSM